MIGIAAINQDPFSTEWKTDNAGATGANQIGLPLYAGGDYDFWVYWGDGTADRITAWDDAAKIHTYAASGSYSVRIEGKTLTNWNFNTTITKDPEKITAVRKWGRIFRFGTAGNYFLNCTNLDVTATDIPIIPPTFAQAFTGCATLTDLPRADEWEMSAVTSIYRMFYGCVNFNGNVGNWNLPLATNFQQVFDGCAAFNNGGSPSINNWRVPAGQNFSYVFRYCAAFNQPIGGWQLGAATTFNRAFWGCSIFDQDLSAWDVSTVTDFSYMFYLCSAFNNGGSSGIGNWQTDALELTVSQFQYASEFNQPIGGWNMAAVTNTGNMFFEAIKFNQDLSAWDVAAVTYMGSMFRSPFGDPMAFDQNLGAWDVQNVANFTSFLVYSQLSVANYDALLIGWAALPSLVAGLSFNGGFSQYSPAGAAARDYIISTYGWTFTDGGPA